MTTETNRVSEAQLLFSPHEIPEAVVQEMLEQAPAFVARDAAPQARKSAEPTPHSDCASFRLVVNEQSLLKEVLGALWRKERRCRYRLSFVVEGLGIHKSGAA